MQPYKRKKRTRRDMFVLGGWLFADLLLGLAMLFAVANTVGQAPPTPTPTATPNELATAEFQLAMQQQSNEQTVEALQGQIDESAVSAQQTQEAAEELFLAATQAANDNATRQAMTVDERATADAQSTQDAAIAQATIEAMGTEQASSEQDASDLNNQLATNVAQATQAALDLEAASTQQAAVAQIATENAASGADAQATSAAAQSSLATSEADLANAQATSDATGQQVANAQATTDAANQEVANAQSTAAAAQQQVQLNSLGPNPVIEVIQVDMNGVLAGDANAVADAEAELDRVLGKYVNGESCRIGFVNVSSRAPDIGQGVQLSTAMADLIQNQFPELLPEPADGSTPVLTSNPIAYPNTTPVGEVELQLFLSAGCEPAG